MKLGRILLVLSLALVGCRGSTSLGDITSNGSTGEVTSNVSVSEGDITSSVTTSDDNHVSETDIVEKVIGPSGGEVVDTANNLSINIPAGALNEDTVITINHAFHESAVSEAPSIGFLGAAIFGPSGLKFNVPVEVNLKLNATPDFSTLTVYCYYEEDDVWGLETEATVAGDVATFSVTHFSKYKCLNLGRDVFEKYFYLVHDAYYNSKPDSYITATYREYLVNQKYVMDYYQNYGYGYYNRFYKPIGLLISGNYQMFERTGDPNELVVFERRESRFGNRLGAAYTGSGLSSWAHCVKGNDYEECEQTVIHILIGIHAEIIDPKIDVSCDKKVLQKGESATVNVYAHYENPANRLYPDFPMSYYILTFPYELKHLRINKDELILDADGRGSFIVTALDTETETVKVQWYYHDVIFNGYGAGYVTFNDVDKYLFSGHVVQELEFTYKMFQTSWMLSFSLTEIGQFKFKFEYDLDGELLVAKDGTISGEFFYRNVTATLMTTRTFCTYTYKDGQEIKNGTSGAYFYKDPIVNSWSDAVYHEYFTGSVSDTNEVNVVYEDEVRSIIVDTSGDHEYYDDDMVIDQGWSYHYVEVGEPFLPFTLTEGTQNSSISNLKDSYALLDLMQMYYDGQSDPEADVYFEPWQAKTTQSLTLELVNPDNS